MTDTEVDKALDDAMIYGQGFALMTEDGTKHVPAEDVFQIEPLRCLNSGNPSGTDTYPEGIFCQCENCKLWRKENQTDPEPFDFDEAEAMLIILSNDLKYLESSGRPALTIGTSKLETLQKIIQDAIKRLR